MTADGRDFATLSKDDVRALPRTEQRNYDTWEKSQKNQESTQGGDEYNNISAGLELKTKDNKIKIE